MHAGLARMPFDHASMSTTELVRDALEAFSRGDLEALATAFARDAKSRAVEDGGRSTTAFAMSYGRSATG